MQKRVSLARAIATEPEIIFFDEPTTGLDPIMSQVINELIKQCVDDLGATALSITHDMQSLRVIGDNAAMIYEGKSSGTGRPATSTIPATPMSSSSCKARPKGRSRCRSGRSRRPQAAETIADGEIDHPLCLPELRRQLSPLDGQVRVLRRLEQHRRGSRRARRCPRASPAARARASSSSRSTARRPRRCGARPAMPSSTASPAAGWCAAPPS